jgi:hypothetical protein
MTALDRAKEAAEKAKLAAQQGLQQGQAKIDALQARRRTDVLLHRLGKAYYDEQRRAGRHEDVEAALAALDVHAAETGDLGGQAERSVADR